MQNTLFFVLSTINGATMSIQNKTAYAPMFYGVKNDIYQNSLFL